MTKISKKDRKNYIFNRTYDLFTTYNKFIVVDMSNVTSNQLQKTKMLWPSGTQFLIGKNTTMKKSLSEHLKENKDLEKVIELIKGNVAFVFTNADLKEIKNVIMDNKRFTYAKVGSISQCDVWIEASLTGMGPDKTSYFQALGIPTKITKGKVEIISKCKALTTGDKVGPSQANLLYILDVKPFTYFMQLKCVYENNEIYDSSLLDITTSDIFNYISQGVSSICALSLGLGIVTKASLPYEIINGYKNLLGISMALEFDIPETIPFRT
ncbi:ribosomal protein L10 [Hamiltosporidium tvaerminnensis]|uniref:Large ribosomal subunit protein uL10 n=1 Tax=Hamiltosporidium tvaerminnensis TaxID=1176355 RepID=A0A4Q9KRB5_9MICR|nr:ribosomal protein L10 [Hamiltosporidium tvaerminnensis]